MTKIYTITCFDDEDQTFNQSRKLTEDETWSTPLEQMFFFLKGCGFVFGIEDTVGVVQDGEFRPADPDSF